MLLVAFLVVFLVQSYQIVQMKAMQRSETLGITLLLPAFGLVLGGLFMIIQLLNLLVSARLGREPEAESQPAHFA
jgi:TRAP-type C4-dicarboxylate transport system permease small subunit